MNTLSAQEKLAARIAAGFNLCIGLDTDISKCPEHIQRIHKGSGMVNGHVNPDLSLVEFNKKIIQATGHTACAFKPNIAFYASQGARGIKAAKLTIEYIKTFFPEVLIIADAKLGDIGNTNEHWARFIFDYLGADAVTLSPFMGWNGMKPFLDRKDKLNYILCCTSNEGADEFQDLRIAIPGTGLSHALYEIIARNVQNDWNYNNNCALVTGATVPEKIANVRSYANNLPLLIPGVGTQQGDLQASVDNAGGNNFLVNVSRDILYASTADDFAEVAGSKAQFWHNNIFTCLNKELPSLH